MDERYWSKKNGHLKFRGSDYDFEKWREDWYRKVPRCHDFVCCHELMSCGIAVACGDCSSYNTMKSGRATSICEDVDCSSCSRRHDCKYGRMVDNSHVIVLRYEKVSGD